MKQNVIKTLLMSGDVRGPASRCQGVTEPFTAHRHNGERLTLVAIVAMSSWSGCAVNGGCDHDGIPSIYATQQDWNDRIRHLRDVHIFTKCNSAKKQMDECAGG